MDQDHNQEQREARFQRRATFSCDFLSSVACTVHELRQSLQRISRLNKRLFSCRLRCSFVVH